MLKPVVTECVSRLAASAASALRMSRKLEGAPVGLEATGEFQAGLEPTPLLRRIKSPSDTALGEAGEGEKTGGASKEVDGMAPIRAALAEARSC